MQEQYLQEDEITLKELILKIQEYYREVMRNWKWVVLITIPFVAWFLYKAVTTPASYTATLTYMVNEDEGGGLRGMTSILSQFGLGGGGKSEFNLDKIVQLSKSRKILQKVLFEKATINAKKDLIANHILDLYEQQKTSDKFHFVSDSLSNFTRIENQYLKKVYRYVVGDPSRKIKGMLKSKYKEETGILKLTIESPSEELSFLFIESLYDKLSSFYVDKTIEKQKQTYEIVKAKADSIGRLLNNTQYQFLNFDDKNQGLLLNKYRIKKLILQRDLQAQTIAYAEIMKNLEIADFSLKTSVPVFQMLDEPLLPLSKIKPSKKKAVFLGALLGFFLTIGFIFFRKVIRETLATES